MSNDDKTSPEWTKEAVVRRLRAKAADGRQLAAQIFVCDDVGAEDLLAKAQEIVDEAAAELNLDRDAVKLGKVHGRAKSFSVISRNPEVFKQIAKRSEVKSLLESEQADILPKPVRRKH